MSFLTVKEVAARLKVSAYTVCEWLKSGKLKGRKIEGCRWRVTEAELQEFVDKQEVAK